MAVPKRKKPKRRFEILLESNYAEGVNKFYLDFYSLKDATTFCKQNYRFWKSCKLDGIELLNQNKKTENEKS